MKRSLGRTPTFITVGLALSVFILGFNYWAMSSQRNDLQTELDRLQETIESLEDSLDGCNADKTRNNRKLVVCNEDFSELENDRNAVRDELNTALENLETTETQLKRYQDLQKKGVTTQHKLEGNLRATERKISELTNINTDLMNQLSQARQQTAQLQAAYGEIDRLRAELNSLNQGKAGENTAGNGMLNQQKQAAGAEETVNHANLAPVKPVDPANLPPVKPGAVEVKQPALTGIKNAPGNVLNFDSPDAPRPRARFSVADRANAPPLPSPAEVKQDVGRPQENELHGQMVPRPFNNRVFGQGGEVRQMPVGFGRGAMPIRPQRQRPMGGRN